MLPYGYSGQTKQCGVIIFHYTWLTVNTDFRCVDKCEDIRCVNRNVVECCKKTTVLIK